MNQYLDIMFSTITLRNGFYSEADQFEMAVRKAENDAKAEEMKARRY